MRAMRQPARTCATSSLQSDGCAPQRCARACRECACSLATVSADSRPFVGPVDGVFFRGAFYFGSSPESARFRHIRRNPNVSATHLPGEELAVTVHGRASFIDVASPEQRDFRAALLAIYVPRYGPEWETQFLDIGPEFARGSTRRECSRSSWRVTHD